MRRASRELAVLLTLCPGFRVLCGHGCECLPIPWLSRPRAHGLSRQESIGPACVLT